MQRNKVTGFKVKFDMRDYTDIIPEPPLNIRDVINYDKPCNECKWQKQVFTEITPEIIAQETMRALKVGVWIFINKQMIWLPPNYYFFLQYGTAGGDAPKFRLKRLKHVYFRIKVRNNPAAIGTYTVKNRQDGETTMAIHDALWECMEGNMRSGQIGIQSKTNDDAKNPCWTTVTSVWNGIPLWFKDLFYSDFASKNAMAEQIKFESASTVNKVGRQILFKYYPAVHDAMDGKNNMRICILDEVNKWIIAKFYKTFINYKKFIAPGKTRLGIFNIFSSPSDTNGKHNDDAKTFWQLSDPDDLDKNGTTKSRVFRYYSNPLEGVEGFYDDFGDADADEILPFILQERENTPEDERMAEVRALPLNENEMFESFDEHSSVFSNSQGINDRMNFLLNRVYKDEVTKEPCVLYGNLDWKDGIIDNPEGVVFRAWDGGKPDLVHARFQFSYLPKHREEYKRIYVEGVRGYRLALPRIIENVIGCDPIDKRRVTSTKGFSNAAMVNNKFLDLHNTGIKNLPTAYYSCRPQHSEIFFEDAIKFCIFMQAPIQVENLNSKIIDHFEDRGYIHWMLSKRGQARNSLIKGDAPTGGSKGAFLNEMIMLVDNATNTPLTEDDPYLLEDVWFYDLLDNVSKLNPKDTQKADGFNAWGQSLIGEVKLLRDFEPKENEFAKQIINYALDLNLN